MPRVPKKKEALPKWRKNLVDNIYKELLSNQIQPSGYLEQTIRYILNKGSKDIIIKSARRLQGHEAELIRSIFSKDPEMSLYCVESLSTSKGACPQRRGAAAETKELDKFKMEDDFGIDDVNMIGTAAAADAAAAEAATADAAAAAETANISVDMERNLLDKFGARGHLGPFYDPYGKLEHLPEPDMPEEEVWDDKREQDKEDVMKTLTGDVELPFDLRKPEFDDDGNPLAEDEMGSHGGTKRKRRRRHRRKHTNKKRSKQHKKSRKGRRKKRRTRR
tara:strand:+ start:126 stop:956 length:831 start_codon:yes stop_codon:yes gene_type:complete